MSEKLMTLLDFASYDMADFPLPVITDWSAIFAAEKRALTRLLAETDNG